MRDSLSISSATPAATVVKIASIDVALFPDPHLPFRRKRKFPRPPKGYTSFNFAGDGQGSAVNRRAAGGLPAGPVSPYFTTHTASAEEEERLERDVEGDMVVQRIQDAGVHGATGTVIADAAHITTMLVTAACGAWHGKTSTVDRGESHFWDELGWAFTMRGLEICRFSLNAEGHSLCAVAVSTREVAAVPRGAKGRATLVRPLVSQVRRPPPPRPPACPSVRPIFGPHLAHI